MGQGIYKRSGLYYETINQTANDLVRYALAKHTGNRSQAAKYLGITRTGLVEKMRALGIELNPRMNLHQGDAREHRCNLFKKVDGKLVCSYRSCGKAIE